MGAYWMADFEVGKLVIPEAGDGSGPDLGFGATPFQRAIAGHSEQITITNSAEPDAVLAAPLVS